MRKSTAKLVWREIPGLEPNDFTGPDQRHTVKRFHGVGDRRRSSFASISVAKQGEDKQFSPTAAQLLKHPLAIVALVPKDTALFAAGAIAGAAAKTVIAPLDRVKLLMQTHGLRAGQDIAEKGIGFIEITYPLDVLRLRLAVEAGCKTMTEVALNMLREEGFASFYNGLGPSLIGIAPYIAGEKGSAREIPKRTEASLSTALVSATVATVMCYPLDTIRRQMQMKDSPYKTVLDAFPA